LLGLAIPGFSRWLPNYRLRGAARDLYSNLQLAKSGAIKDRGEWAIRFTSATSYEVWSWRSSAHPTDPNDATNYRWDSFSTSDDTLIKTVDLSTYGSNVTFSGGSLQPSALRPGFVTADSNNPIRFTSRSFMATSNNLCAYMTNSKNTWYGVGTLTSGVVDLKRWNGAW
jgi:Tfp pilus assembly protein FimT